jgi:hypothetical protein
MKYLLSFLLCISVVYAAPTPLETTITETLVAKKIIVDQSKNPKWYRLTDTITRSETVGVALRVADVSLEDTYFCKNYFRDVKYDRLNNWVCRAMEIAADYNIISRTNDYAKPKNAITRIEALAIIMRAGKVPYQKNVDRTNYPKTMPQWEIDILEGALQYHIISSIEYFGPDKLATRMDVFGMIYNMQFAGKNIEFITDKNIPTTPSNISLSSAPEWQGITVTLPGKNTTSSNTSQKETTPILDNLVITLPSVVAANEPFDIKVTAVDANGKTLTNYTGTIYFDSNDTPFRDVFWDARDSYTFTLADRGIRTFGWSFQFLKAGDYELVIYELSTKNIEKIVHVTVVD